MADKCLSPLEFGKKIGKNENFVSTIKTGATKKLTPKVIRLITDHFPEYSKEWLRTGEPPIYAAEVAVSGNGNIGNGNGNAVSISIPDRVLATLEQQAATIKMQAEQLTTVLEMLKSCQR